MRYQNKFFRNRYLIAICEIDEFEFMVDVFDNAHQFANQYNRPMDSVNSALHRLFIGEKKSIIVNGKRYKVEFVKITNKEIEEYGKETK